MNTLVILDSKKYIKIESEVLNALSAHGPIRLLYTDYENGLIRFLHSLPFAGNLLSHLVYWSISLIYALKIIIFFRRRFPRKVFINPIVGFFYCGFKSLFGIKDKTYIAGFLFVPKKDGLYYKIRKHLVVKAFKTAELIYVYSSAEPAYYSGLLPELQDRFRFIRYGRDFRVFEEKKYSEDRPYIASGGSSGRDYQTLIKAFNIVSESIPDLYCYVATRPWNIPDIQPVAGLKFLVNIRPDLFGSFIEQANFVVLPLQNTALSSGHMTLLEALSRRKIVIVADIKSIRDYVDENSVIFYTPEDYTDLSRKIEDVSLYLLRGEYNTIADSGNKLYIENYTLTACLNRLLNDINTQNRI